jgi:hypothetical protein
MFHISPGRETDSPLDLRSTGSPTSPGFGRPSADPIQENGDARKSTSGHSRRGSKSQQQEREHTLQWLYEQETNEQRNRRTDALKVWLAGAHDAGG